MLRLLIMLLRHGRAIQAIQSSLNRLMEVPSKLILKMLDGVIPQLNATAAAPDTMTTFYLEKVLEVLDRRENVSTRDIAIREYQFLPLLEHTARSLRIHELMANDPAFFHSILSNVYRGAQEQNGEVDQQGQANARLSYSLLRRFSRLPGDGPKGIDGKALASWIDEAGAQLGRAD